MWRPIGTLAWGGARAAAVRTVQVANLHVVEVKGGAAPKRSDVTRSWVMTRVSRVAVVVDGVALESKVTAPIIGPHLLETAVANKDNVNRATAVHVGESGIHGMLGHHRVRIISGLSVA